MTRSVLFVGAHPDDVETGALGLLLMLRDVKKHYLAMSKCLDIPRNERILEEYDKVTKRLDAASKIFDFPNRDLYLCGKDIRKILEDYRDNEKVDAAICPSLNDVHQDHRALAEEVVRVFKHHTVLFYELPNSCLVFEPRFFQPLTDDVVKKKLEIISLYESQRNQRYMEQDAILASMRFRGLQIGHKYAEAFEIWRIVRGAIF